MKTQKPKVSSLPRRLFTSKLKNGWKEFSCYLVLQPGQAAPVECLTWKFSLPGSRAALAGGEHLLTQKELSTGRVPIAALLPPEWEAGRLAVELGLSQSSYPYTWKVESWQQPDLFRIPFEGQVLIFGSHRVGEVHRAAWEIPSQQFAWDMLPLHPDGLRLLKGALTDKLLASDFSAYGQAVLAPAAGQVTQAVDGIPDHPQMGPVDPAIMQYYLEDLTRACGNYVILDHGSGVWSCLAHLRCGSVRLQAGDEVTAGQVIGELGNSGSSTGPHLHIQFMDGPGLLSASPLPVEFDMEGEVYAPQVGEIVSS
jgi:murein DD-endopeptidase MepM/ murein hydrolase activator NlpD